MNKINFVDDSLYFDNLYSVNVILANNRNFYWLSSNIGERKTIGCSINNNKKKNPRTATGPRVIFARLYNNWQSVCVCLCALSRRDCLSQSYEILQRCGRQGVPEDLRARFSIFLIGFLIGFLIIFLFFMFCAILSSFSR